MPGFDRARGGGRRTLAAATAALALTGVTLLGVAAAQQAPAPPAAPEPTTAAEPNAQPPTSPAAPPPASPSEPARPDPSPSGLLPASPPVQVTIPAIGVDASLVELGLQESGAMEVPDSGQAVGWYVHSPTPGEVGPTVLAGHVSWDSRPAVFFDLAAMQPGQQVSVAREDGASVTYEVTRVEQYPKDAFPTLEVYGNTPGPQLRLITCGGEFDEGADSHRDNIVVYATATGVAP